MPGAYRCPLYERRIRDSSIFIHGQLIQLEASFCPSTPGTHSMQTRHVGFDALASMGDDVAVRLAAGMPFVMIAIADASSAATHEQHRAWTNLIPALPYHWHRLLVHLAFFPRCL
jgi:hypothetical protein